MNDKPILAMETSDRLCGVCVYFNDTNFHYKYSVDKYSHSKNLYLLIDETLKAANVKLTDFKWIAVSIGPGSFTGLRIGLAASKGLALGANLRIVPVPTFEAAALQLLNHTVENEEFVFVSKVNKDEIYFSSFINKKNLFNFAEELKIISASMLQVLAGEKKIFSNSQEFSNVRSFSEFLPEAFYIAKWSQLFGENKATFDFDYLEPNYVKQFITRRL